MGRKPHSGFTSHSLLKPLVASHHITFSLAWLNPHYHKLINTSVVAQRRPFIYKLTVFYIFGINPPKEKIFHRIRLHLWLCQSPININREINGFSHPSWYVCFFEDTLAWGFCRTVILWISHMNLLNKKCWFLSWFTILVWIHSTLASLVSLLHIHSCKSDWQHSH